MVTIKENDLTALIESYWFDADKPLVSCLMLTYNRFKPFKKALDGYLNQTYPNRELIIINSGTERYSKKIRKYIQKFCVAGRIKHFSYMPTSIGELRNAGMEYCVGDYIIGFDDDDIHHPERISRQVDLCLKSNIQGTLLKNYTAKTFFKEHECTTLRGLDGTLLFKNPRGKIQYTDMNKGEDTNFIEKLRDNDYNIVAIDEDYDTYKYVYHHTNTVGKKHFKEMIELNKRIR